MNITDNNIPKPVNTAKSREFIVTGSLVVLLILAILVSLMIGRFGLPPGTILRVFIARLLDGGPDSSLLQADNVLFIIRLPRIFLTILVGASLSLAGAAYQSLFKNPLVSPDILGVTSGAGMGAALGILLGLFATGIHLISFSFGIVTVIIVLLLTRWMNRLLRWITGIRCVHWN